MRLSKGGFQLICADYPRKRLANVRRSLSGTPVFLVGGPGTSFRSSCATRLLLPRDPVIERTHILLNRLWKSSKGSPCGPWMPTRRLPTPPYAGPRRLPWGPAGVVPGRSRRDATDSEGGRRDVASPMCCTPRYILNVGSAAPSRSRRAWETPHGVMAILAGRNAREEDHRFLPGWGGRWSP